MRLGYSGFPAGAAWLMVAVVVAGYGSAAFAQQAASPAQVEQRLKPRPEQPSVGAPIQIPQAPPPAAADLGGALHFTLSGVDFEGGAVLPAARLQALAAPYIGKSVTLAQVNELAARVTAAYRGAGYILVRAVVPPQQFGDGRLTLKIVEGFIDSVKIQGDPGGARGLLEAYGRRITAARPLTQAVLERELLLAGDLTGLGVRSVLTPSATTAGAADLTLVVTPKKVEAYASVDNRGSRYLGPEQLMGGVFINDAFGTAGRLGLNAVVTPDSGPDLAYGAISFDQPLGSRGLRLFGTVSYTATRPGSVLRALDTTGAALNVEGSLSYPIIRSRALNLMATGGFAVRDVRSSNSAVSPLFDDHVRSLDVGLYANALDDWGGYSTLSATVVQGLGVLGATRADSPDKSHVGASGEFTRLDFEATHQQPLFSRLSLLVGVTGQTAFGQSLLSSEQFALGGYNYDRAFDPSELSGDSGLAGRAELQWQAADRFVAVSGVQPYVFYEGGQVWQSQALPGTPLSQSLYSAGVGVRFALLNRVSADLEWAHPFGPDAAAAGGRDGRVFFGVNTNF
jgi:hemolysin activation/secretion protein